MAHKMFSRGSKDLLHTLFYLMTIAGRNASCFGTEDVEGVAGPDSRGNSNYKTTNFGTRSAKH